jgi:hypothetical protein
MKKGPDLAIWACKSTLEEVEETTGAKIRLYFSDDFSIAERCCAAQYPGVRISNLRILFAP